MSRRINFIPPWFIIIIFQVNQRKEASNEQQQQKRFVFSNSLENQSVNMVVRVRKKYHTSNNNTSNNKNNKTRITRPIKGGEGKKEIEKRHHP